jgi:hypothetical protein
MSVPHIVILSNIFKSLGIKDSINYACYLTQDNLFGHFNKMIMNKKENNNLNGGGNYELKYNGIDFTFNKYKDDEYVMFVLNTQDKKSNCLTIRIIKKDNLAEILGLGYYPMCFTNKQIKHFKGNTSGTLLLKLALHLINTIKDHYKIKRIFLQDNSFKICHGYNIPLSTMSILMYGETWYGKHGFDPCNPSNYTINKIKKNKYEDNKEKMNKLRVKDYPKIKEYIKEGYTKISGAEDILIKKNKVMKLYDEYYKDRKLLKDFLKKFLEDFDKSCLIFYSFHEALYDDLELHDFYKASYIMNI